MKRSGVVDEDPQNGISPQGAGAINTLISLSRHALVSRRCLPLGKPNRKPEKKGSS